MDCGDDKIATLIADLEQSDKPALRKVVDALIQIAGTEPQIVETLTAHLADTTRKNRWAIAYILASLPVPLDASAQILLDTLDHRDPDIRWAVALILVRLAKTDSHVLELLTELASKGSVNQRRMAIYALRDVGSRDPVSLDAIVNSLADPDPTVRVAAVTSLRMKTDLDNDGKIRLLELFLKDPDLRVRNTTAVTLAQLGETSEEFLDALRKANLSGNPQLQKAASTALDILKKRSAPSGS